MERIKWLIRKRPVDDRDIRMRMTPSKEVWKEKDGNH